MNKNPVFNIEVADELMLSTLRLITRARYKSFSKEVFKKSKLHIGRFRRHMIIYTWEDQEYYELIKDLDHWHKQLPKKPVTDVSDLTSMDITKLASTKVRLMAVEIFVILNDYKLQKFR